MFFAASLDSKLFCSTNGVSSIGVKAFANNANLLIVKIPASVTFINPTAFSNCNSRLTIAAPSGSYAADFADEQNIPLNTF